MGFYSLPSSLFMLVRTCVALDLARCACICYVLIDLWLTRFPPSQQWYQSEVYAPNSSECKEIPPQNLCLVSFGCNPYGKQEGDLDLCRCCGFMSTVCIMQLSSSFILLSLLFVLFCDDFYVYEEDNFLMA